MLTSTAVDYPLSGELKTKIDYVISTHDNDPTQIVGILLEVQDLNEMHYVPEPVAYYLAAKLDLPITQIFDCLNFYAQLSSTPRAKYPIQICNSPACRVNQANTDFLLKTFEKLLDVKLGETTYDGRFTIETTSCYGACDRAPSVRINGKIYDHLDSEKKIEELLRSLP
ncbi:MAG: NAD(P)H-dependent oxidoreductase subunit E [Selenomonadaceae bacterium]|nr:NAD(P)H-dependent oxidoreductase subunit E [Selenomonadaceae bacterium]MBP3723504.1 NAD(P)H-dependent oxidoreductase subunit E [Selenomonadaceae bacterium]